LRLGQKAYPRNRAHAGVLESDLETLMPRNIIYIVGLVVIVLLVLGFFGLR
jgi:hypothetical protein